VALLRARWSRPPARRRAPRRWIGARQRAISDGPGR